MAKRKYVKENNLVKAINTDSLELQKPLVNEYYDINVHNSNMDKIDLGYKQNKNDVLSLQSEVVANKMNISSIQINVLDYGIEEGVDVDVQENTRKFQQMIDECKNDKVIFFPAGVYLLGKINLGTKNNITLRGVSSSFASFMNKDINTGEITDTFTQIICCAEPNETFFEHNNCVIVLDKIGFYNYNYEVGTGIKKNVFMSTSLTNKEKGKIFATECGFHGFKVVFGDKYTLPHLEDELQTGLSKPNSFLQCCVLANRCRFTNNGVGINQNLDGRVIDCSFNKNNYGMIFRESSGFTTVSNCRIEWNLQNGIYIDGSHNVTVVGNEFDRNGSSGLTINNANFCTFDDNFFRRNGAYEELTRDDYDENVHIVMKNSKSCIVRGCNTISKNIMDTSSGGITRPTNCSNFSNNRECIITDNMLVGCTKSAKLDANKIENNIDCIITDNIPAITNLEKVAFESKISILEGENKQLKLEQEQQNEEILVNMLANTEIFEMILGMIPMTLSEDKTKNSGGNSIVEVYCTLIIKNVKTIEDVPLVIKEQVIERLKQLEVPVK